MQFDLTAGHSPQLVQLYALPQVVLQLLQTLWLSVEANFSSLTSLLHFQVSWPVTAHRATFCPA